MTRLEIWFWDFSESRLEIIIKVRSGGFYLYLVRWYQHDVAGLPLKGGLDILLRVTSVRVVRLSLGRVSVLISRVADMNKGYEMTLSSISSPDHLHSGSAHVFYTYSPLQQGVARIDAQRRVQDKDCRRYKCHRYVGKTICITLLEPLKPKQTQSWSSWWRHHPP